MTLVAKKVILAYMVANLINGKVEIVPWIKTWYVFGEMKSLGMFFVAKTGF